MGANGLKMGYQEMEDEIRNLLQYVEEFESITNSMTSSVTALCDGWESASTETYREDYTALTNNFAQTLEVVRSLIQSTSDYITDMQTVDSSYSKSKVSRA